MTDKSKLEQIEQILKEYAADIFPTKKVDFGHLPVDRQVVAQQILDICEPEWVPVSERFPKYNQMVVLIDINRYANNGDLEINNPHVNMCGYLTNFGGDYWSVYGERGMNIDAFTHWKPLSPPPEQSNE